MKKQMIIFMVLLTSCCAPQQKNVTYVVKQYKLVSFDPPKHFYVTLQDVETGVIYHDIHVSKHCNNSDNLKIGTVYSLKRLHWIQDGRDIYDFDDNELYQKFCE